MQDRELLAQFVENRSQQAFAELVHRHMDAVYSSARRQVRDSQLAEDVAQAVFLILARKAARLVDRDSIAGWLMKTTHLASLDAIKIESRRKRHEHRAAEIAPTHTEPIMTADISSELDRALSRLKESDRSAITLRYLHGKSIAEAAALLGIAEPAATKRISRALARLRSILLARRAILPTIAVAIAIEQIPRLSAPAALASSTISAATAGTAAPAGLLIAKGTIQMMTFHKILAAVLLIGIFAGVTGIGIGAAKLLADQNTPPSPPPAAPVALPDHPPVYRASLSNGVAVEVIGIGEHPSTGKQWWLANGELLNTPPYDGLQGDVSKSPGYIEREFAVAVSNSVNGSPDRATVQWSALGSQGAVSGDLKNSSGKTIPGLEAQDMAVPDAASGATIHAMIAAGQWNTMFTAEGFGQASMGNLTGSVLFSSVFNVNGQSHIVIGYSGTIPANQDFRLVAIDRTGRVVPARGTSSISGNTGFVGEFAVSLPRNSIRQWQLQSRPYDQWIEIRGISLHAGQKTNVTIVTSDDQKNP